MSKPYFVSAPVDFALAGGASIAAYGVLRAAAGGAGQHAVDALTLWSYSFIFNGAHFAATNYRLYSSRQTMAQYPLTAALIPLAALAGLVASLARPESLAPFFVKLFLLWSPFHYSGQSLGVSLVYAGRAGRVLDRTQRLSLGGFIYGSFLTSVARGESVSGRYFGISLPALGLPGWLWHGALAATLACGAVFAALETRSRLSSGKGLPAIVLVPAAAQFVWLVLGPGVGSFFQLVPMFHGLQYLLIAWFMQMQTAVDAQSGRIAASARWAAGNAAGYLLLFWGIPRAASWACGQPILFAAPVALAAVQIHHFFVDGVIWKLRDPKVGAPLMAELA
ncbi:MAG: hypothetical protein HY077_09270 [Elusimicrobia bacterium]|nr:hypothetical protein [Elusimicrobiota bacterium]